MDRKMQTRRHDAPGRKSLAGTKPAKRRHPETNGSGAKWVDIGGGAPPVKRQRLREIMDHINHLPQSDDPSDWIRHSMATTMGRPRKLTDAEIDQIRDAYGNHGWKIVEIYLLFKRRGREVSYVTIRNAAKGIMKKKAER